MNHGDTEHRDVRTYRGAVPNASTLGELLAQAREARGLTQRELAAELGVTQKWIWQLEQGKPGLLMTRLFAALRVTGLRLNAEYDVERPRPEDPS